MARRAILFGAALALISAIALIVKVGRDSRAQAPDLGSLLAFSSPRHCQPSPQLERLLDSPLVVDERTGEPRAGASVTGPGFPEPLHPRLNREFVIARDAAGSLDFGVLDVRGRWQGLNVTSVRADDGGNLEIRFSDDPARVREALIAAGFPLPPIDQWRYSNPGDPSGARAMSVHPHRLGGASLMCSSGY